MDALTEIKTKWGSFGDPKTEKGPRGPQMETHLGAVVLQLKQMERIKHLIFGTLQQKRDL